ncbi:MAG: ferritin-like domain-containing protein [Rhodocyclaceae bacterium]
MLRVALQGAAVPAACYVLARSVGEAHAAVVNGEVEESGWRESIRSVQPQARIIRDFSDPYIELLRLLHEAAEIEHALMIQYLYAAFSVKPAYAGIVGHGGPNTNDLMGVAVQEMQHLGKVNQFLVALGAAPTLIRDDFPYEPDIYPFRFNLEPLTRASVAKYTWTEAPVGATDSRSAKTVADRSFCHDLEKALGAGSRPNYVGTLYDSVIAAVEELIATKDPSLPDLKPWLVALHEIQDEGEIGHFPFFKAVFLGTHEGFGERRDAWNRNPSDPLYPSFPLPVNPTAYLGHEHQIGDPKARSLAWLGNLHYWILLILLHQGYSTGSQQHIALARAHMMGAFWSLARKLASIGAGMPFDPLGLGYAPGVTRESNLRLLSRLLDEADQMEKRITATLPADYPADCCRATRSALAQLSDRIATARGPVEPWDDGLA